MRNILCLFLLLSFGARAQNPYSNKIDQYVQAQEKMNEFNGVVMVIQKGKLIYEKPFGLANRELNSPNTIQTKFKIGSLTKQFTAAAILQLVEAGKLNLDDKLSKYFPGYPKGDSVTIHMLLTHTSGIKNYTSLPNFGSLLTQSLPLDSVVALFKDEPYQFSPGTNWSYSNSGYYLLGYIIEKLTGQSYSNYVLANVMQKAGLGNTLVNKPDSILANRAAGYSRTRFGFRNAPNVATEFSYSAGAMVSTAPDLYEWNKALYSGKIVSTGMLTKMTTNYMGNYGYGLDVDSQFNHRRIGHSGGIPGFVSHIFYFPAEDNHIIVLSNNSSNCRVIANVVGAILFDKEVVAPYRHQPMKLPAKSLEKFVGKYQSAGGLYEVILKDGKLYRRVSTAPDMELVPESPNKFFYADGSDRQLNFVLNDDGSIRAVQLIVGDIVEELKK